MDVNSTSINYAEIDSNVELSNLEVTQLLAIPDDLTGKSVLELFSGRSTLQDYIQARGGQYNSLDIMPKPELDPEIHILGDAYATGLPDKSRDAIIMRYMQIRHDLSTDEPRFIANSIVLFTECFRLLKDDPGSFISLLPIYDGELGELESILEFLEPDFQSKYNLIANQYIVNDFDEGGWNIEGQMRNAYGVKIIRR